MLSMVAGTLVGWLIWTLSLAWALVCVMVFLRECLRAEEYPEGPEACLPSSTRRLTTGANAFGVASALCVTGFDGASKLHLL